MPLQFETVAIPVTKGIDLRTAERLIEPPALLQAVNARLNGEGSQKRYGHVAHRIRAGSYPENTTRPNLTTPELTPYGEKVLDSRWLFGWGIMTEGNVKTDGASDNNGVSPYPEPGYAFGGFERDSELVAWTGHSLISYAPGQNNREVLPINAVMPMLNAVPVAKIQQAQHNCDAADTGSLRMVVWTDQDTTQGALYYAVYSSTGATVVAPSVLINGNVFHPRVLSLGTWFHVTYINTDDDTVKLLSFSPHNLRTYTARSLGACAPNHYDVWKVDETKAVVLRNADSATLSVEWLGVDGQEPDDETAVDLTYNGDEIHEVAICTHPITGRFGVAVLSYTGTATTIVGTVYNRDGSVYGAENLATDQYDDQTDCHGLTIAPKYLLNSDGIEMFDVYASFCGDGGDATALFTERLRFDNSAFTSSTYGAWLHIISHAFRVGDRTYVWAAWSSTLQSTYLLLDEELKPVGHMDFGVATAPENTNGRKRTLKSVNYRQYNTQKDQLVYHLALGFKVRVATTDDQQGLFTEPSIQFVKLDFLPPLRSAQAGRATYVAGSQVWSFDGTEAVESGFHIAPEFTLESDDATGSLTEGGTYTYRIDLCYKNAQNEEVRSHSLTQQITLETGESTEDTVYIRIKNCPTRREGAYFLIFRTAMLDAAPTSTWNLLNSRDPNDPSFLANDPTALFSDFTDDGSVTDADLVTREIHPGNSSAYQHPFASPACEVIASGRDRVWVAGGELPYGTLAPSRLFLPSETPAWNGNLLQQIDRNEAPITGIGFVGEIAVIFRERYTYILEGDGTDNSSNGYWPPARLALADIGARSPESIVLTSAGLFFQGPAGFRLLNPGGQIAPIGEPVDDIARSFVVSDALVVAGQNEVRWYGPSGAIVYNYSTDSWSTWTCGAVAALQGTSDETATLIRSNGFFFVETPGVYRDGDSAYTHLIRFPWLHAGAIGDFQRLRRFSGMGEWDPEEPHEVEVKVYYDERDFPEETFNWDVPDATQNTDTWGSGSYGDGVWGDTASTFWARDSVWRWRRRPRRQKCSVFSISISDNNSDGPGFTLVALGLELAKKTGLDRTAVPGGTNNSRS